MTSWRQHAQGEWSVDDMPDQSGKVFLITGGNTGLGKLSKCRAAWTRLITGSPGFATAMASHGHSYILRTAHRQHFQALLRRNATVYITSRDRERGQQALERLRRISETIHVLPLDLSDLHSVRRAALEFMRYALAFRTIRQRNLRSMSRREKYLHVLINNAYVL